MGLPSQQQDRRGNVRADSGRGVRIARIGAGIICLLWMIPIIGELVDSFRTREAQQSTGWWTALANPLNVTQWTLDNYAVTLFTTSRDGVNIGQAFVNSFVVAVPASVLPILVAGFAAYAFTFMRWWGRDYVYLAFVGLLLVPSQVALVPLLKLYDMVGLNGTFVAVWLVHVGFGMPLAVVILRNHMWRLPRAVIESAQIDGASHFTMFWRLVVPMSVPAFAAFAIVQFLWVCWALAGDLGLVRPRVDEEGVLALVEQAVGLLRDDRGEKDVPGVLDVDAHWSAPSVVLFASPMDAAATKASNAPWVKTTSSAHSTS